MDEIVDVTQVEVVADYRLRLNFSDGSSGEVDFAGREWRGVFAPLRDPAFFAKVAVDPELGTIIWPGGIDMAPETLHESALGRLKTA